jgi:inhibitor of growth protein 3
MANGAHSHLGGGSKYGDPLAPDWTPPNAHQLEGPGMPVQRNGNGSGLGMHQTDGVNGGGDVGEALDPDEDEQYCSCRRVSFGEMIACDDDSCEIDWVGVFVFRFSYWN